MSLRLLSDLLPAKPGRSGRAAAKRRSGARAVPERPQRSGCAPAFPSREARGSPCHQPPLRSPVVRTSLVSAPDSERARLSGNSAEGFPQERSQPPSLGPAPKSLGPPAAERPQATRHFPGWGGGAPVAPRARQCSAEATAARQGERSGQGAEPAERGR